MSHTCGCGKRIVRLEDTEFWRLEESGEVCNDGHWHQPVESAPPQPVAAQEKRQGDQRCPRCNSEFVARRNMVISDGEPKRCVHFWHFGDPSPSPAATTQPKPAPQAEGFEEWWNKTYPEYLGKMPTVERLVANKAWSADQAPLLQKIAELESLVHTRTVEVGKADTERLEEISKRKQVAKNLSSVESKWKTAEARIAELESAQTKAEKLVSYDWIKAMVGNMDEDEPTSQSLRELQQYRQREERRER